MNENLSDDDDAALQSAVWNLHPEEVERLLSAGLDANMVDSYGDSLLYEALHTSANQYDHVSGKQANKSAEQAQVIRLLIEHGADADEEWGRVTLEAHL